jgi:hypothetical protein
MRTGILIDIAWALFAALVAYGVEEAPEPDEYVVWVDQLNLRGEPSTGSRPVMMLEEGMHIKYLSPDVVEKTEYAWNGSCWDTDNIKFPFSHPGLETEDDFIWRRVRADEKEGWVPDRFVLRADINDAFKEADERGKAGDAAGMREAIIEGYKNVPGIRGFEESHVNVSPDVKKIVVFIDTEWDKGYAFPDTSYEYDYHPLLFFVAGRGIVDYERTYKRFLVGGYNSGIWSADSRYFAIPMEGPGEWMKREPLDLLDTNDWERVTVGRLSVFNAVGFDDTFEFEFVSGYLVWKGPEKVECPVPPPLEEESYSIVINAYNLDTGESLRVLETDLATLRKEPTELKFGLKTYKATMVPAGTCPPEVRNSRLYNKFVNKLVEVEDSTHWME